MRPAPVIVTQQQSVGLLGLFLHLADRRVVVVGGGPVALRKTRTCLATGADVNVIAPDLCPGLQEIVDSGGVDWSARVVVATDVVGAWLVFACTNDSRVNEEVVTWASERQTWAVNCSDGTTGSASSAATAQLGDGVNVAVSGGGDPRRAQTVRDNIVASALSADVSLRRQRSGPGRVVLIGGGPGDPDLITVRGKKALLTADLVLMDRLAPAALADELRSMGTEIVDVGKAPGQHALPQQEINKLIVSSAQAGKVVARLKGGDPFVLGRGSEEAQAALDADLPVEVIPGITSALSVPAAVGIPVTHRGLADSFLVLSGHDGAAEVLARAAQVGPTTTLVLLMGVRHLPDIASRLIAAGRDPATPAAVIESGFTPKQRLVASTLADLPQDAHAAGVSSPAIIIIGSAVGLAHQLGELVQVSSAARHLSSE